MIGFANLENTLCHNPYYKAARVAQAPTRLPRRTPRMDFTLRTLLKGLTVPAFRGDWSARATSIITDSRRVSPGALFFAIGGLRTDGNRFVDEAIFRGAVGIVSEAPPPASNRHVAWVQVENVRAALAEVSRRFYRNPDRDLRVLGITGTKGKTTVSFLLQHLLQEPKAPWGLIGTVRYDLGGRSLPSYKTTPESVDVYAMLDQMRDAGCRGAVMEISSHAIDQRRVQGLNVEVAAFLNLSRDHLDYHHTIEEYFQVKARLFTGTVGHVPRAAVINIDDPHGHRLVAMIPDGVEITTVSCDDSTAAVHAEGIRLRPDGSDFTVVWPEGRADVSTGLPGRYNVSNVLAALAIARAAGFDIAALAPRLTPFAGVPGRMEKVQAGQPFQVLVDYAHTDDSLNHALSMLRDITPGRLFVVFGCGGNRDRGKRPLMTAAVQRWADFAWATSDNPRKETIQAIFDDMKAGVSAPGHIRFVEDRRRAISLALDAAGPGDCVLIAGKGHETYQEFADTVVPFDDRQVARELLALKRIRPE